MVALQQGAALLTGILEGIPNLLQFPLEPVAIVKGPVSLLTQGAACMDNARLRQIHNAGILLGNPLTAVGSQLPGHNLHEGGLAGTIGTAEGRLGTRRQIHRHILQNVPLPKGQRHL